MNTSGLREYVTSFQQSDGSIGSENSVKATAEFILVHRFCPEIHGGNLESARSFLREALPVFASHELKKDFRSMESIWQVAVGIPEDTMHLSDIFAEIACSSVTPAVKSALLLLLSLQGYPYPEELREEVISYQYDLFTSPSLDALYETTHNCMTFWAGRSPEYEDIIMKSCVFLSHHLLSYAHCIDLVAESLGVLMLMDHEIPVSEEAFSLLEQNQNADGGFPIFEGGPSEFHPSLVVLWALTALEKKGYENKKSIFMD